jgi:hypothetical protein
MERLKIYIFFIYVQRKGSTHVIVHMTCTFMYMYSPGYPVQVNVTIYIFMYHHLLDLYTMVCVCAHSGTLYYSIYM